jgi:hypothetical protein
VLHVWHRREELARREESEDGVERAPAGGFGPPSRDDLASIPWGGEGDDPLETIWEAS